VQDTLRGGSNRPAPRYESEIPFLARFAIQNALTIDGVQLRDCRFLFDIVVNKELHTLKVRPQCITWRSMNLPMPLPFLASLKDS
jgi:hypothetical protein